MANVKEVEIATKTVGGLVSESLAWDFKLAYTKRRETAAEALSNALRLYIEIDTTENNE